MPDNNKSSRQLARLIYTRWMSNLKFALDYKESECEKGRDDPKFKLFKKVLMSNTYECMRTLFMDLDELGLIEPTEHDEDVKNGYKDSPSGGSGYINTPELDDLIGSAGLE